MFDDFLSGFLGVVATLFIYSGYLGVTEHHYGAVGFDILMLVITIITFINHLQNNYKRGEDKK